MTFLLHVAQQRRSVHVRHGGLNMVRGRGQRAPGERENTRDCVFPAAPAAVLAQIKRKSNIHPI